LDADSGEFSERRFAATPPELIDWAMPLRGQLTAVAIEATSGWRWLWRELSGLGFDVRLADPARRRRLLGWRDLLLPRSAGARAGRRRRGDAFAAGLLVALARGAHLREALEVGCRLGTAAASG
jgi:transposase